MSHMRLNRKTIRSVCVACWLLVYEMNDPLGMESGKLAEDYQRTGLHPVDRMAISCAWGDRILDLAYLQPALGPDQADEAGLCLWVRGQQSVPVALVRRHLDAFFACSVLKGQSPDGGGVRMQLEQLGTLEAQQPTLATLDIAPHLADLRVACDTYMNDNPTDGEGVRYWLSQRGVP